MIIILTRNERYQAITPVTFRVGDIVEAKATLMVIPLRGGHYKLTAVLRSITILDTTYTQVNFLYFGRTKHCLLENIECTAGKQRPG